MNNNYGKIRVYRGESAAALTDASFAFQPLQFDSLDVFDWSLFAFSGGHDGWPF